MTETFLSGGKQIHMDVRSNNSTSPHPAIILLHGAGGNIGFWFDRLAPNVTAAGVSLFAPHYFERTGTVRADLAAMTDGIHVPQWLDTINTAVETVAARPGVDPNRIALVGISLGAFLSLGLAATHSATNSTKPRIRCLVELSGGLVAPFAAQATSSLPPTLVLHGESDEIVPVARARELDTLLTKLNVPHETKILPREGHWFTPPAQMQLMLAVVSFLRKHL